MSEAVLIIEDETSIAETLQFALEREGFTCHHAPLARDAQAILADREIGMMVLDVGLPDRSGFDLLKDLRTRSRLPVLVLTARGEEVDRIVGFELGADDYVVKPFSPREVVARVKAILRRGREVKDEGAVFLIDSERMRITYFGEALPLSRYEFRILRMMVERPGWVFSRDKIMDLVWDVPGESFDRTVDTHIKTLRAKLKAVRADIDPIVTHRGMGYSLKEHL